MSHPKSLRFLRLTGLLLLLTILATNVNSQVQTAKHIAITGNTGGFYEYLPQGYNSSSESYPLLIAIHGLGELGDGGSWELQRILSNGVPNVIKNGQFPVSFNVNGQTHKFIVISPQFRNWPSSGDIDQIINYAINNYRVNTNRIYLTGLSMGGGATWDYAGGSSTWANRLAAIVPVCGASWPDVTRARTIAAANLAVWATHNDGDGTVPAFYTNDYINYINSSAPAPNPTAKKSVWGSGSHDAWSQTYNPNYRENNMNVYEWMLQFQRGGPVSTNQAPTANAGPDQVVAPSSGVQLNGSGNDPDGTIAAYNWTKIAGPSQFTLNNAGISNPYLSNLLAGTYTFRLTVTDNGGRSSFDEVIISVPASLPGKVEAEDFSSMSGVQTENTADAGAGQNVGYIDNGDWMDYNVSPSISGTYTIQARVATQATGGQFQVKKLDGTVLATVTVPNTGGYQSWQTVSANIALSSGNQTLRIVSTASASWNVNWFDIQQGVLSAPVPPVVSGNYKAVPAKIEAETWTNQQGVQTENTADAGGGLNVGYIDGGDYMDYNINPAISGSYTLHFRVATANSGGQIQVKKTDGTILGSVSVPVTGGWQAWQTISTQVNLVAGNQTLRIHSGNGNWNINWIDFVSGTTPAPVTTVTTGKIEAENYLSMYGVQKENTADAGGGQNIGYVDYGDWMDYTVNIATAGTYSFNIRVASQNSGGQLVLKKADGTTLGTITVPATGGWQSWQNATTNVTLAAGQQTVRIYSANSNGWNLNWFEFTSTGNTGSSTATATQKVEAEQWSSMWGVQTENTSDAGGGQNVGYIDNGDWMDYSVNVPVTGAYTFNLRTATPGSGAQAQLKSASGTVLGTLNINTTGGWQTWGTVSVTVNLTAGQQTLRIQSTGWASWNVNYFELVPGTNATVSTRSIVVDEVMGAAGMVNIFPNRVQDRFSLKVSNAHTGSMNVEIIDANGTVVKKFNLKKSAAGTTQTYLNANGLKAGEYTLKVQMNDWIQTSRLTKQ